jgi:hypothetical protein
LPGIIRYFTKLLSLLDKEWKESKKLHNWDYTAKCKSYMEGAQILNNELKTLRTKISSINPDSQEVNLINGLLSLEESNYKLTINIFLKKLNYFNLLKSDADDDDFNKNENEIVELKMKQTEIRETISDFITALKYDNKK